MRRIVYDEEDVLSWPGLSTILRVPVMMRIVYDEEDVLSYSGLSITHRVNSHSFTLYRGLVAMSATLSMPGT